MAAADEGGRDGAAVQADLRSVIERARREDPRAVLGLAPSSGAVQARAAFHALCKKYHPAKFARSSAETVRLANEAFLAIKRAYDVLVKPEPAKPEPPAAPAPMRPTSGPIKPVDRPTERVAVQPLQPRPATGAVPAPAPAPTPKATEKLPPQPRPTTTQLKATDRLPAQKVALDAATEEQRFTTALDLLRRRLWRDAEKLLGELAVSVPAERKYRAYRHYARGRLAQDEGRLDEARGEWERALRLEPELNAARAAIDQLPEPPKPSGGLLSKLFKR